MAKTNEEKLDELEAAFFDALDGNSSWWDIVANTGLSEERAKEIENLFHEVSLRHMQKYNIG